MSVNFDTDSFNEFGDDSECKEMVQEVQQLNLKFAALLERKSKEKFKVAKAEHESLVGQLEKAEQYGRNLLAEQASYFVENAGVDNAVQKANHELHVYKRDYTPNPIFALEHDLEQFDQTVEKLEAAKKAAVQVQSDYNARVASWRAREYANSQEVRRLTDEVIRAWRIKQRLEGKPVGPSWSRENGLPIPADEGQMKVVGVGNIPYQVKIQKLVPGVGPYPVEDQGQTVEVVGVGDVPEVKVVHKVFK
jgi:hypothetical protein